MPEIVGATILEHARSRRSLVPLVLPLVMLVGCNNGRPGTISAIVEPRDELPARADDLGDDFVPHDCFLEPPRPYAASCGTVRVPESDADGARGLDLAVMILYKRGDPPPPDPVVYLEGGPGGSALATVLSDPFVFEHILEERDLVLIDQRGTGFSDDALYCENTLPVDASRSDFLDALGNCFDDLTQSGYDLGSYTTRQIASDFDRVRRALGYSQWNLYGISYGSRLALTMARDYPDSVRSVAVDGVLPLQIDFFAEPPVTFSESLDTLAAACAKQYACDQTYGDVIGKMFDVADRLDEEPAELVVDSGDHYLLDGTEWVHTIFELMYYSEVLPYMPAIIELTESEDYSFLESLYSALVDQSPLPLAMYYSVVCGDEAPFTSPALIDEAASDLNPHVRDAIDGTTLLEACDRWPVPAGPDSENEGVSSDLPALVTSGAFDPITPPRFAEMVAGGLANAYSYVLPDQSHGSSISDCGKKLVLDFFDDPSQRPEASCVGSLDDPVFEWSTSPHLSALGGLTFETTLPLPEGLAEKLAERMREGVGRPRLPFQRRR